MRYAIFILSILPHFFIKQNSIAQDPQFTQFHAAPMYINPAFAGNTEQIRFTGNYRKQWPEIPGSFTTYAASFDYNLIHKNSGTGFQLLRDKAGSSGLRFTNLAGFFSHQFSLDKVHFVSLGMKASYTIRDMDYSRLVFPDQLYRHDGSMPVATFESKKVAYPDFSAGMIFYSAKYWVGTAMHHLNRPNQSLIGLKARLPMDFTVHGGYSQTLKRNEKGKEISSLSIVSLYKAQLEWDQADIGFYFKREPAIAGLWYRGIPVFKSYKKGYSNDDAIAFLAGFFLKDYHLTIGYSYDLTISRLAGNSGGSHEISLIYEYASPDYKKLKPKLVVPCPKFNSF